MPARRGFVQIFLDSAREVNRSVEIFDVSAREGFDPNFLRFRKRGFSWVWLWVRLRVRSRVRSWSMSTLVTWINNHADVVVVHVGECSRRCCG